MEWLAAIPEWVVWFTAGGVGLLTLLLAVGTFEAVLDLEHP